MPAASEFVAHDLEVEEICAYIGADWLVYQDLDDLVACASGINPDISGFDTSVFDGLYVTGQVDAEYLQRVELLRNDSAKQPDSANAEVIELHNQG